MTLDTSQAMMLLASIFGTLISGVEEEVVAVPDVPDTVLS
jgi:hypothetical protein